MTKPAASNSGPRCQKLRRRSSWTVDEARKFLETSRSDDDPLYPLWVLIVVLGLRKGEALGLIWPEDDDAWPAAGDDGAELPLEWQLQRVGGHPLTHKHQLKADGSTDTLPRPLPPIVVTALRIARRNQDKARQPGWPRKCICGETHTLVLTTRNGRPIEPRNINRAFDIRCARAGVRRITIHDTRRTCGSLLAALDVHPRVAMAILRHSRIALTMEIYTQVPDASTRVRSGGSATCSATTGPMAPPREPTRQTAPAPPGPSRNSMLLYFAAVQARQEAGSAIGTGL